MAILIDGYNLLHATGIMGRGIGPGSFERSRNALLNYLAAVIDTYEIEYTSVVFDAKDAPPGLPREVKHRGISVHYAAQYEDADELIEELIRVHPTPRRLTVVSSDHRIQRAARRRKAAATDSDVWYADMERQRRERDDLPDAVETKPPTPLSESEVARWISEFGDVSLDDELNPADVAKRNGELNQPAVEGDKVDCDFGNPFPPGYAEDLLEDGDR